MPLLQVQDRLDAQVLFPDRILELGQQVGAQVRGVIGEFDQVAAAFLEDLEGKAVLAGVGDESAVQAADAPDVALGIARWGAG